MQKKEEMTQTNPGSHAIMPKIELSDELMTLDSLLKKYMETCKKENENWPKGEEILHDTLLDEKEKWKAMMKLMSPKEGVFMPVMTSCSSNKEKCTSITNSEVNKAQEIGSEQKFL